MFINRTHGEVSKKVLGLAPGTLAMSHAAFDIDFRQRFTHSARETAKLSGAFKKLFNIQQIIALLLFVLRHLHLADGL